MTHLDFQTIGAHLGKEFAISDWFEVTQARVDAFAEATGDHQWIHVDPARAAKESPFKTTIAHGFLTLSLVSTLTRQAMSFTTRMAINYGCNRVRFVSAVPVGAKVRGRFTPAAVEAVPGGVQITWAVTVEREGQDKPCAVVEWIVRYYTDAP